MSDKHQVGYSGADSMREKAKRLFGDSIVNVDMNDVPSKSKPSAVPMRKYAKGGHVKGSTIREGAMLPKSAKGEVQGGTLTDMHMPKKNNALKKGGKVDCYKDGGRVDKVKSNEAKKSLGKALKDAFHSEKPLASKTLRKPESELKELGVERKVKSTKSKTVPIPAYVEDDYKKGGSVRAKTTSPMRKAMKGRTRSTDQTMKKGQSLDVGSVKELATPKKASMLKPKPASNGDKHSKLNVESKVKMNGMKSGGKCKK